MPKEKPEPIGTYRLQGRGTKLMVTIPVEAIDKLNLKEGNKVQASIYRKSRRIIYQVIW